MVISHSDEQYRINIRDYLIHQAHVVRVDVKGNIMNLAVLSEDFYADFLNTLFDLHLKNANADKQNTAGIDLIDLENHVAVQVSLACAPKTIREKIRNSIRRFDKPTDEKWQFYFVPITDVAPELNKGFSLPEGLIFDKDHDVLDIARLLTLASDRHKLRPLSQLVDQYSKEDSDYQGFKDSLDRLLLETWKNHRSFKLMHTDDIDRRLFPGIKDSQQFEALGKRKEGETESPVWSIIRESWKKPENHPVMIEGKGGIGKTVTLFSVNNMAKDLLLAPAVYVPMFELIDKSGEIINLTNYFQSCDPFSSLPDEQRKWICALAAQPWEYGPSLLVLLDGFNEVPGDRRWDLLMMLRKWHTANMGAQLIAVSRPMDNLKLENAFGDSTISITLSELKRENVAEYLKSLNNERIRLPEPGSPAWDTIIYPLFLTLYIKSELLRDQLFWKGYPLMVRDVAGPGSLIWNYLQRELFRQEDENWILRCALACEYIVPELAYRMLQKYDYTVGQNEAVSIIRDIVSEMVLDRMPKHLTNLFSWWKRQHFSTDLPYFLKKYNWAEVVLQETGLLTPYGESNEELRYEFFHQSFGDCLAGLYLVNQAEQSEGKELPPVWGKSQNSLALDYAAELMDESTADRLWEINRKNQQYNSPGYEKKPSGTYALLELLKRRKPLPESIDFSGMDLQDLNLTHYMGQDGADLSLFQIPRLSINTKMNRSTFQSDGHGSSINCLLVLPDGRVVSGSDDRSLRVWNLSDGRCLQTLKGHSRGISCIGVLPDGRVVSGSGDHSLRVWDLSDGRCLQTLEGHYGKVSCVAVLPDGRVVSGSADRSLRVWDPSGGRCLQTLHGHSASVSCVAVLPDGRIVSGSDDRSLRVWDPSGGRCLQTLHGHSASVSCVAALADGRIVSGSYDGSLRVWDTSYGLCLYVLKGHLASVSCVAALPDGHIVSGSDDRSLRVWDPSDGRCFRTLKGPSGVVSCVAVLPDGRVISGSDNNTLRVWLPDTGECLNVLITMDIDVLRMDFSEAILTKDLAKMLWQNGAMISNMDYEITLGNTDSATDVLNGEIDRQLSTLINSYLEGDGKNDPAYSHFLEYINKKCPIELKSYVPTHMSFLFSFEEEASEVIPTYDLDVQELLYRLFLLDRGHLVISPSEGETAQQQELLELSKTIPESKDQVFSEALTQATVSDPDFKKLEQATYYVLQEFEKWLSERNKRNDIEFEISKHPRQQPAGLQYGYDVGMNNSNLSGRYRLCFECKCYWTLKRGSNSDKVKTIKIDNYAYNLIQYYMHCSPDYNNRWILVCPFGDLQANFQESLFDNWNDNCGHDYLQIFAITEEQSMITCRDFLSVDERAYKLIYHDSDELAYPKKDKEKIFESLYNQVVGDDLVQKTVTTTLHNYFKTENEFLDCKTILEVQTSDNKSAFNNALDLLQEFKLKSDKTAPDGYGVYIIGEYGSGKTWLSYRIIEHFVRHRGMNLVDPVLIRMKEIVGVIERRTLSSAENITIAAKQIVNDYLQNNNFFDLSLRYRRCKGFLFVLDGLDEVLSGFSYTIGKIDVLAETISALRQRYPSSLFVVTSRESDYNACKKNTYFKKLISKFSLVELHQFKAEDVIRSINKQAEECERDKERLHQLAANEKFVRLMQTPIFFTLLPVLVERPELLRVNDENGDIDRFDILNHIVSNALKKPGHTPGIEERVYNYAIRCTRDNIQEVSDNIPNDITDDKSDLTISKIIPTDIMKVRSISGSDCALSFKHNIIREFLVAKQLYQCLVKYCNNPNPDTANNDFCQTIKEIPMTVETQQLFMDCIRKEKNDAQRNCCLSALKAMVCATENKKDVLLSTKLLELLLQPNCELCGEKGIRLDLSGIHINNLYIWRSSLKHVNLRNAHINGLQLIDAELHDVDFTGAELYNLHMCTDDKILCVSCRSNGNGCLIIVVFDNGQILQYDLQNLDPPIHYTARLLTDVGQVPYANAFFTNSNLLIHTKREVFLSNQKAAQPIYRMNGKYDLEKIIKTDNGFMFVVTNSGVLSTIISTSDTIDNRILGAVNPMQLCAINGTAFCYVQNGKIYYSKGRDIKEVTPWVDQNCCYTANYYAGVLTIIILRVGRLIKIKYYENGNQTDILEIVVDKEIPFQTVQWITETVFLATNESSVFILRINEGICNTSELAFSVRCSELQLGVNPGEKRLQDDVSYQMLSAALREDASK